jgi:nucleotide-binding universal stress UspA family protein
MTTQKTFTVLVGVDYSELSALTLTEAIATARSHERSHVHVIHTLQTLVSAGPSAGAPVVPALDEKTAAQASEELRKYVEKVLSTPHANLPDDGSPLVERLTTHIGTPYPAEAIAQLASDIEADLVVVGTHGRRGMARLLLGSVAEGVVRLAPCPVLVVRPRDAASSNGPKIEPPCPRCVETRRATDGKEFWCEQHREHHQRRHTYHLGPVQSGHQSGLLIPMSR